MNKRRSDTCFESFTSRFLLYLLLNLAIAKCKQTELLDHGASRHETKYYLVGKLFFFATKKVCSECIYFKSVFIDKGNKKKLFVLAASRHRRA